MRNSTGKRAVWSKLRNTSFFQMNFRTWKDGCCETVDSNREAVTTNTGSTPAMPICRGFRLQIRRYPCLSSPLETGFQRADCFTSGVLPGNTFEGRGKVKRFPWQWAEFCLFPCDFSNHSNLKCHETTKIMPLEVPGITPNATLHPFGCHVLAKREVCTDTEQGTPEVAFLLELVVGVCDRQRAE